MKEKLKKIFESIGISAAEFDHAYKNSKRMGYFNPEEFGEFFRGIDTKAVLDSFPYQEFIEPYAYEILEKLRKFSLVVILSRVIKI